MQQIRNTLADIFAKCFSLEADRFQLDALEDIVKKFNSGSKRLMTIAPVGSGKTTMSLVLAKYLLSDSIKGVLILTFNKNSEMHIKHILAEKDDFSGKNIEVSTAYRMMHEYADKEDKYLDDLKNRFDVIIADDFHDYDVKKYRDFFNNLNLKLITFSSPDNQIVRYEGTIPVIELKEMLGFNEIEFQLSGIEELLSVKSQVNYYRIQLQKEREESREWQQKYLNEAALFEKQRSEIISEHVKERARFENELGQKDKMIEALTNTITQLTVAMNSINGSITKLGDDVSGVRNDINSGIERLSGEIHDAFEKISGLIAELGKLQQETSNKISRCSMNENEEERIYHEFSNTLMKKIDETVQAKQDVRYNIEKDNLIAVFGKSNWNKLSPESIEYLITSRIIFNNMLPYEKQIDFSPACIPLTKALERETFIHLFDEFKTFCRQRKIPMESWPHGLTYYNRNKGAYYELKDDKFSLGSVPYIIGVKEDNSRPRSKISCRDICIQYWKESLFRKDLLMDDFSLNKYLGKFGDDIEFITKRYRNRAAHKDEIKI